LIFHEISNSFGIDFNDGFLNDFEWQLFQKESKRKTFWWPFGNFFRRSICWCILVALRLTFATLLVPTGSLWVLIGSLLAHLGFQLAFFGHPLVPLSWPWGGTL
jgi:hypothetical protein